MQTALLERSRIQQCAHLRPKMLNGIKQVRGINRTLPNCSSLRVVEPERDTHKLIFCPSASFSSRNPTGTHREAWRKSSESFPPAAVRGVKQQTLPNIYPVSPPLRPLWKQSLNTQVPQNSLPKGTNGHPLQL